VYGENGLFFEAFVDSLYNVMTHHAYEWGIDPNGEVYIDDLEDEKVEEDE
jgi:hypothetical protein